MDRPRRARSGRIADAEDADRPLDATEIAEAQNVERDASFGRARGPRSAAIRRAVRTRAPTRPRPEDASRRRTRSSSSNTCRLAFDRADSRGRLVRRVRAARRIGDRRRIGHRQVDDAQAASSPARSGQRPSAASTARTSRTSRSTEALKVRQKMGMVFQGAALFDSMTVFENVAYPLREHTRPGRGRDRRARPGEAAVRRPRCPTA